MCPVQRIAIRCYGVIFCLGVILAELEVTKAIRDMVLVQNWVSRGAFYSL